MVVLWTLVALLAAGGLGGGGALSLWYWGPDLLCPAPCVNLDRVRHWTPRQATVVLDVHGQEVARFGTEYRRVRPLRELPRYVPGAFLAVEDARFYAHAGVDPRRVLGALWANVRARRVRQGSSTITMQLARNVWPEDLPARDRGWRRKVREMAVARQLERELGKDEILERYVNTIYLGEGAYGVEAAARTYFGHGADSLSVAEAALLAALPQAPSNVNPVRAPRAAERRRNLVLGRMVEAGVVSAPEAEAARATPVHVVARAPNVVAHAGYYVDAVRALLTPVLGEQLTAGGLVIHTGLDLGAQAVAESVMAAGLQQLEAGTFEADPLVLEPAPPGRDGGPGLLQGAAVVLDPATGTVRALVGGRSWTPGAYNRATMSRRQPGSTFKPFIYGAALEHGWRAASTISDGPVSVPLSDGTLWTPRGAAAAEDTDGDGVVEAPVRTLASALAASRNAATVRLGLAVGLDTVAATARRAGLFGGPPGRHLPPSGLLGSEAVSPLALTSAYTAAFRDDGRAAPPRLVTRVSDAAGRTVWAPSDTGAVVWSHATAIRLRRMLRRVVTGGTATRVHAPGGYAGEAAGKTGTSNDGADLWFVGGTDSTVAGVWIGYDTPVSVIRGPRGTGGHVAAPIWGRLLARLSADSGAGHVLRDDPAVRDGGAAGGGEGRAAEEAEALDAVDGDSTARVAGDPGADSLSAARVPDPGTRPGESRPGVASGSPAATTPPAPPPTPPPGDGPPPLDQRSGDATGPSGLPPIVGTMVRTPEPPAPGEATPGRPAAVPEERVGSRSPSGGPPPRRRPTARPQTLCLRPPGSGGGSRLVPCRTAEELP